MLAFILKNWELISNIGLINDDKLNNHTKHLIKISNQLAFFYVLLFTLSILTDESIRQNSLSLGRFVSVILINLLIIFLNYGHQFFLGRFISVYFPALFFYLPPLIFRQVTDFQIVWFPFGLIIFSILPLILFDLRKEFFWCISAGFFYLVMIVCIDTWLLNAISSPQTDIPISEGKLFFLKRIHLALWLMVNVFYYRTVLIRDNFERNLESINYALHNQIKESQLLINEIKTQNNELKENQIEISAQKDQILTQKNQISEINTRLERHQNTLMQLTQSNAVQLGRWNEALNLITHSAAINAKVSRVSIWEYSRAEQKLNCLSLFNAKARNFEPGVNLLESDYPIYFSAILKRELIVANNAYINPYTFEFAETYLKPLLIQSMLDAPFFISGELKGVICFEQQDVFREWTMEDISFAKSLADIITIAYKSYQRSLDLEKIKQQSQEITLQNKILLQQKELIDNINQSLEARINERTHQLELQNKQLGEYAFINAHHLRGPLCRIIGLVNLLEMPELEPERDVYLSKIRVATQELDDIIQHINRTLEENSSLEIEDLQMIRQNNFQSNAPNWEVFNEQ